MTDQNKLALTDRSNKLLGALDHLRDTEQRKRQLPISTPAFHALADEVTKTSGQVFRLARDEDWLGDESPRGSESINDVDNIPSAQTSTR